jgi:hypothetical protein
MRQQDLGKAQSDFEKRVAKEAAQQVGRAAVDAGKSAGRTAFLDIKEYTQENPWTIQLMSFFAGMGLTVFSVLGVVNPIGVFSPEQYLTCVYNAFFGLAIVVCDGPPKLWNRCCNAQDILFKWFLFLANPTGRAIFYFYVGTHVIFILPENNLWKIIYFALGGTLVAVGIIMLLARYCGDRLNAKFQKQKNDGGGRDDNVSLGVSEPCDDAPFPAPVDRA